MTQHPEIAVLTPDVLVGIGLKTILEKFIPEAVVETYADFDTFAEAEPERFYHYFVAARLFPAHASFFRERRHKTILLADGPLGAVHAGMHALDIRNGEERLVHDILHMHRGARHRTHIAAPAVPQRTPLTDRETEVLTRIARGYINKQIADELGIGLTTVISHRRNIMDKLHVRSVAELILYAVAAGYVDPERI